MYTVALVVCPIELLSDRQRMVFILMLNMETPVWSTSALAPRVNTQILEGSSEVVRDVEVT